MSNLTQGTAANVLVGPARLLVAPIGSTLPTLDGTTNPVTWDAAFKEVGYTDDGVTLVYNPTIKDIMVDEEMAPVKKILEAEKCSVQVKLAEATLQNLARCISASTYAASAADSTHAQLASIKAGSGSITEVIIAFEGLNQAGLQRIFIGYRAIPQGNVSAQMRRSDKVVYTAEFGLVADSTKSAGQRLFEIVDILAAHS